MNRDSWATPMAVYRAMDHHYNFAMDICASHTNAKHPKYLTEDDNSLEYDFGQHLELVDRYVWCNPPYSDIGPWIDLAIRNQALGIGTVLLVMADSSVGWYYNALMHGQVIREVVKGRISFLNPETGKPVNGNNKGSLFIEFMPRCSGGPALHTYIERDRLIAHGEWIMTDPIATFLPKRKVA